MSLLTKALDKAAKERAEANGSNTAAPHAGGATRSELALEPLAAQQGAAPGAALRSAPPPDRQASAADPADPAAQRRGPAQAAAIIQAGRHNTGSGVSAYLREHLLVVFGVTAALFLIGLGSYVYLQMNHPGLRMRVPAPAAAPVASPPVSPVATAPDGTAPAPTAGSAASAGAQPLVPLTTLLSPLLQESAAGPRPAPSPPAAKKSPTADGAAAARAAAPAPTAAPTAVRDTIKVSPGGDARPTIHPLLAQAYAALNANDLESSQWIYRRLLASEPENLDALLGLAAIATRQGDPAQASRYYQKVLELDPRNAPAQAALIGMFGRIDPLAAESRLKQLIERAPSGYLYFTLGNVYADASRWPEAQQAYFQAHHLQSDNPDYAYNLAVALDRIGQVRPALNFYRRALQLAATRDRNNFSTAAAQERISRLEKVME